MATLYIAEFPALAQLPNQAPQDLPMPPTKEQTVAIDLTEPNHSKPFQKTTGLILVSCDVPCSIEVGDKPKADTSNMRLGTPGKEYRFGVTPGHKISVIAN